MPAEPWIARLRARGGLVSLCVLVAALPVAAVRPISDPSPWLHLKVGSFLGEGRRFSLPDPWAPFAEHAFVPTQWLPSVVTSQLVDLWGLPVVAWERAAGIGLLATMLLAWAATMTRLWVAALITVLTMIAAWPSLTERPQLAGFLLLVPTLAAWTRTARDHRARRWLVPLTWLSACVHGIWATGGAIGAVVVLCLLASRSVSRAQGVRLMGLLGACAVAGALTPLGPKLLLTPFTVGSQGREFVQEWQASSVRSPSVLAALTALAAAWLCWILLRRKPTAWELALLVVGSALVLTMQRTVAVGAFVALPLVASALEETLTRRQDRPAPADLSPRRLRVALAAATVVGLLVAIPVAAARGDHATGIPSGLSPALSALPDGTRIIADGDITGWLLQTQPRLQPVFDLRIESYSTNHVERFIDTLAAKRGWREFVTDTGTTTALVKADAPLLDALSTGLHWHVVGSDAGLVLIEAPR